MTIAPWPQPRSGGGKPLLARRFLLKSAACLGALGPAGLLPRPVLAEAAGDPMRGAWGSLMRWPIIPIHMVMTRDGRIMSYGSTTAGQQSGYFVYDIWDPDDGPQGYHLTLPNGTSTDVFCSAQVLLPDVGDILIAGGDVWTGAKTLNKGVDRSTIYLTRQKKLVNGRTMNRARWYATVTTLPNGESYIQGGDKGTDHPEVRGRDGSFRLLEGADTSRLSYYYPRNWVGPDGLVFGLADRKVYRVDPGGAGRVEDLGTMRGTWGKSSTEAMFAPGRILRVAGGGTHPEPGNMASVVDINGAAPTFTQTERLPRPLHWSTATLLADGKVVVTGGSKGYNELVEVNYTAFIWDPKTGRWTSGAATTSGRARLYHSTAILLADATVLVGGGGAAGPQNNLDAEIFYPPYLFDRNGQRAARPAITSAPTSLKAGRNFKINVDNGARIARVTLVKTGSATHSFNMDQRFMELPFQRAGNTLAVTAPKNNRLAPPGYYLMFVIDADGVPSVGKVMPMYITAD
jgi:hypothetical protein